MKTSFTIGVCAAALGVGMVAASSVAQARPVACSEQTAGR